MKFVISTTLFLLLLLSSCCFVIEEHLGNNLYLSEFDNSDIRILYSEEGCSGSGIEIVPMMVVECVYNSNWILAKTRAKRSGSDFRYWIIKNVYAKKPEVEAIKANTLGPLDLKTFSDEIRRKGIELEFTYKHITDNLSSNTYQDNLASGSTIQKRINPPPGFTRTDEPANSFQQYLRTLKLKPLGSEVKYYNGSSKPNHNVYDAVIDLEIGKKDLHQCADAVMRLRAEHLWRQKQYDQIHFNFTNGFRVDYREWMKGRRMVVEGNKTYWNDRNQPANTYKDFWAYMELIFTYAGTASLEKELHKIDIGKAEIGDVLIQGGYPGHAVIIVDKAINERTGSSIYLLAQSYMPAQELQILQNPNDRDISPWYELSEGRIQTPEWMFTSEDLKRFEN